jgi:1,4-alpha-glucan branching enzyme
MIRRAPGTTDDGEAGVKLTFTLALDDTPHPVSVLGDFNGWNPLAHPLRKRSNGTRSVSVVVPVGQRYTFKYLADGGTWFHELDADAQEINEYGQLNSVVAT